MEVRVSRKGHRSLWSYRKKLEKFGLIYDISKKEYVIDIDENSVDDRKKLRRIKMFCMWHGLVVTYGAFGDRSNSYRAEFFRHNPPPMRLFGRPYYFCSYCGMPVAKKELQVDHLYPVAKVKSSEVLQKKLKDMGAESVNSYLNLVPACPRCNRKKSAHMGIWIPLGMIGRRQKLWPARWAIRAVIVAAAIIAVFLGGQI